MELQDISQFRRDNESNFFLNEIPTAVKERILVSCKSNLDNLKFGGRVNSVACLRILSRDNAIQKRLAELDFFSLIIREAALMKPDTGNEDKHDESDECKLSTPDVIIEAMKCISNVIFQNPTLIDHLRSCDSLELLISRCQSQIISPDPNTELMLLDLKVLFLCSAMSSTSRLFLLNTYFASDIYYDFLRWSIDSESFDITIEILKILFNLSYAKNELKYDQNVYASTYRLLCRAIQSLLVTSFRQSNKKIDVVSHAVNFLTSIPSSCYCELLVQPIENGNWTSRETRRMHHDPQVTAALSVLVDFLSYQLYQSDANPSKSAQYLTPILTVVATASRYSCVLRKYFRSKILPPLGAEVLRLPESGGTIRNRLCKRLTLKDNLDDSVVEMVAWLIFVLCKENVERAVKYTGFGNFIGFLSRRGILGGGTAATGAGDVGDYSSSSDSETEDYRELKARVNPVTGRVEPPQRSFIEGMSEEQKEYEVMKLVNKLDQMNRTGVFQPGVVEDGRVRPVEHVLELIKHVDEDPAGSDSN